jgi:26S proteasome regulatory subunit N2
MAYQIAFDLYENATQQFLTSVIEKLRIAIPLITDSGEENETKNKVNVQTDRITHA